MLVSPEATDTRYEIVKILGQGASATVYLARHVALNELRVLKILHHDMMMDAKRRTRFKLEAQVAAHLKHPAIVQVYDVTQTTNKLQIEMEYIDGMSLRQHLEKRKTFPLSVTLAIVHAILEGLEHAHRARLTFGETEFDGVIHRDLKPENIMIRKGGQPVICDFGVAKLGADLLTQTQHISGSVAYMAPERLRGELSTRSIDIFAMGVMLFELHKGHRPFPGANKTAVLENILRWNLIDLDEDWKGSDAAVLQIIRKALAREPAQRYQDATQMLAALRPVYKLYHGDALPADVVHDYLVRGQFTTAEFKALMPDEGNWKTRIAAAVAVAAAAGGIAFALYLAWPKEAAKPTAAPGPRADAPSAPAAMSAGPAASAPAGDALAEAEATVQKLKPADRQRAYYRLAKIWLADRKDPGNALLLVNKALDLSFHPTIAALKVEILLNQNMLNLAEGELARIQPWLKRMTKENQAQYHWLAAQLQLDRLQSGNAAARDKARAELEKYLALHPRGPQEKLAKAEEELQSLK
jgi:tRNA A-37 threonylcarbamoyl transferase component Bud32